GMKSTSTGATTENLVVLFLTSSMFFARAYSRRSRLRFRILPSRLFFFFSSLSSFLMCLLTFFFGMIFFLGGFLGTESPYCQTRCLNIIHRHDAPGLFVYLSTLTKLAT